MNNKKDKRPDYHEWAKAKVWTIEQAAFLLNDLDPLQYEPLILRTGIVPRRLKDVLDTYQQLRLAYQREMGKTFYLIYPATVENLALENHLPFPEPLLVAMYQHDYIDQPAELADEPLEATPKEIPRKIFSWEKIEVFSRVSATAPPPQFHRERGNLLKAIGLLVYIHFSKNVTARYQRGDKINAFQAGQTIIKRNRSVWQRMA